MCLNCQVQRIILIFHNQQRLIYSIIATIHYLNEWKLTSIDTWIHHHEQHLQHLSFLPRPPFHALSSSHMRDHLFVARVGKLDMNYAHPNTVIKCHTLIQLLLFSRGYIIYINQITESYKQVAISARFKEFYQPWL